jgi:ADP-dependent NAD(P)H-hydrate dehydratase / NAD(P)H-hydrate epimerase
MRVLGVAAMRAAESAAVEAGISEAELQARAGAAVAGWVSRLSAAGPVVVLVGIGNNGRDGWVTACVLARAERVVRLYLSPRHALQDDEIARVQALGALVCVHTGEDTLATLRRWLMDASVAVDALLGIGAKGAPRPPLDLFIAELNHCRLARPDLRIVAIDVPSGVDGDSGEVPGDAVRADGTVILGAVKEGLLRFPGAGLTGVLLGGDIGLPEAAIPAGTTRTLERDEVRRAVPGRGADGHKGSFGRVLVVAGSPSYLGAPYLAGAAAARSGCGLVAFAAAPRLQAVLAGLLPEATYVRLPGGAPDEEAEQAAARVVEAMSDAQAMVLGPGIGRSAGARDFVQRVLAGRAAADRPPPLVVDADALSILGDTPRLWSSLTPGAVLTPHHGEMARLTGLPAAEIAQSPWRVAREAAERWRQTVTLKGPFTTVAAPGEDVRVLAHANSALATGGTGDVLAGTIAGLLAQGLAPAVAARVAVYVHAAAAAAVCQANERDLLLAGDLLAQLGRELAALRAERGDSAARAWVPWAERL